MNMIKSTVYQRNNVLGSRTDMKRGSFSLGIKVRILDGN